MTTDHASFFLSGLAAGAMCVGEIVMILFVAAGFWRWGLAFIVAVFSVLNLVGACLLVSVGADPVIAALTMMKVNIMAGIAVLPISAGIAWGCGKFWRAAGGIHAK
jgi:hypothetical protein